MTKYRVTNINPPENERHIEADEFEYETSTGAVRLMKDGKLVARLYNVNVEPVSAKENDE
jgi:hypothetical protein